MVGRDSSGPRAGAVFFCLFAVLLFGSFHGLLALLLVLSEVPAAWCYLFFFPSLDSLSVVCPTSVAPILHYDYIIS